MPQTDCILSPHRVNYVLIVVFLINLSSFVWVLKQLIVSFCTSPLLRISHFMYLFELCFFQIQGCIFEMYSCWWLVDVVHLYCLQYSIVWIYIPLVIYSLFYYWTFALFILFLLLVNIAALTSLLHVSWYIFLHISCRCFQSIFFF